MGSTLNVKLCPHKVWREKYGCAQCAEEERRRSLAYDQAAQESVPDSPTSDPNFDSDPDDGGD